MPIMLLLQRVLYASQIRVDMEAFASMMDSTDADARVIILEKRANVSFIAVMYNYKICFPNHPYSESVA